MRRLFTHNPKLKGLALVIALVLWILVTGEKESARIFPVRVNYVVSDDQVLSGDAPATVAVALRGTQMLLANFDPLQLTLDIDLRGEAGGERRIPIDQARQMRGIPVGLAVDAITPQILTLRVEKKIRRSLPVSARIEGAPAPGCRLIGQMIDPTEVLVEGPESQVNAMSTAETERVDLSGLCATTVLMVNVVPDRPEVRLVRSKPVSVTLRMEDMRDTNQ